MVTIPTTVDTHRRAIAAETPGSKLGRELTGNEVLDWALVVLVLMIEVDVVELDKKYAEGKELDAVALDKEDAEGKRVDAGALDNEDAEKEEVTVALASSLLDIVPTFALTTEKEQLVKLGSPFTKELVALDAKAAASIAGLLKAEKTFVRVTGACAWVEQCPFSSFSVVTVYALNNSQVALLISINFIL